MSRPVCRARGGAWRILGCGDNQPQPYLRQPYQAQPYQAQPYLRQSYWVRRASPRGDRQALGVHCPATAAGGYLAAPSHRALCRIRAAAAGQCAAMGARLPGLPAVQATGPIATGSHKAASTRSKILPAGTGLPRAVARRQVQMLARDRHRAFIVVARFVHHVVAGRGVHVQAASVCRPTSPTWVK